VRLRYSGEGGRDPRARDERRPVDLIDQGHMTQLGSPGELGRRQALSIRVTVE